MRPFHFHLDFSPVMTLKGQIKVMTFFFCTGLFLQKYCMDVNYITHNASLGVPNVPFGVAVLWSTFGTKLWHDSLNQRPGSELQHQ